MVTKTLESVRQRLAAEEPELRRRGVCHLAVFGSVARGDDRPDSDIDLAVEIEAGHLSLISHPGEVTQLIMSAVQAVRLNAASPPGTPA